jgi:hypothetical protein
MSNYISYKAGKKILKKPALVKNLDADSAGKILSDPLINELTNQISDLKAEKPLITDQANTVRRTGKSLIIKNNVVEPFVFNDYYRKETDNHEGDSSDYFYSGLLADTGYHIVTANYMHDSPGEYYVNLNNGSILYVHSGEHNVYLYSTHKLLVVNNSLTPPFGLVIINLTEKGHNLELQCLSYLNSASKNNQFEGWDNKLFSDFKGWSKASKIGFDLVIKVPMSSKKQKFEFIPTRFIYQNNKWNILVQESQQNLFKSRLSCWQ